MLTALRGLTGHSREDTAALRSVLGLLASGPETARRSAGRRAAWRRILQDVPVDERSFDTRFGLGSRTALIARLTDWCTSYRGQDEALRAACADVFGFTGLFLLTLVGLAESEAQRSRVLTTGSAGAAHGADGAALTHDCAAVCAVLVADREVSRVVSAVYAPEPAGPRSAPEDARENAQAVREWRAMSPELRFHRHGSTSVILRGSTAGAVHGVSPSFALKLILYPFTGIETLAKATREYARTYGSAARDLRHLVRVWASHDTWIMMEFIEGRTLAETVRAEAAGRPAGELRLSLDRLREQGVRLFDALAELQQVAADDPSRGGPGGVHADLSPSNIIVSAADGAFRLVDLGRNYLYTHTITGGTGAAPSYIAPEVRAGDGEIPRADLYSLGRLLTLFGTGVESGEWVVPDVFHMRAPQLARFLEDLVDAVPERRLLIFSDPGRRDFSYLRLKAAFLAELELVRAAERDSGELRVESGWRALRELARPLAGDPGREWRLWRHRRRRGTAATDGSRQPLATWLLGWSLLSALVWALTNFTVLTWLSRDLNLSWDNRLIELAQHLGGTPDGLPIVDSWRHADYAVPDWRANLPARMVGLSYAIAAPKYYQMLFSGLTPLAVGRGSGSLSRLALVTEAAMRIMAVVPCGLVLAITLVEPRWWPINSAIGQILTWLANVITLAYVRAVIARSRRLGLTTVPEDDSKITGLAAFTQWSPTSMFYAVAVLTIGLLLYLGFLHDVYVYALAVTSTNLVLFYVIKCGLGGPLVRVAIVRACLTAERIGRLGGR
ncbi:MULTISPECIES: putative serine/threonine protein kinase [Kitasatospora]|uniref:non-specific serine/threonine protein kinase n=1 Tax=Kitasatospora setae (strain ATCC 33774 / DSM 43861 / JCM 3304 / KCC A-0304 / NBRC 14216 / KM-6054) TaxID=452652 RepID=E4NKD0_KITSK|nr:MULTISPECIES: putative serine/threonine protein kinase [Kitasatospora]BAJ32738.1 putative serine/threonine protein kinase [Kitasatospora setae KM-6054]